MKTKNILALEIVKSLYVTHGMSDKSIANLFGVDRTAVVHFRKYHGIETRSSTGEIGENIVIDHLKSIGFDVKNMNEKDKTFPFDLLINGAIRVEVKTSKPDKNRWNYVLAHKPNNGISEKSENYICLPNGRYRKIFCNTCDVIIFCGLTAQEPVFHIIPPLGIPNKQGTLSIPFSGIGKWGIWREQWDVLFKLLESKNIA